VRGKSRTRVTYFFFEAFFFFEAAFFFAATNFVSIMVIYNNSYILRRSIGIILAGAASCLQNRS
jgi:hypothetical protein